MCQLVIIYSSRRELSHSKCLTLWYGISVYVFCSNLVGFILRSVICVTVAAKLCCLAIILTVCEGSALGFRVPSLAAATLKSDLWNFSKLRKSKFLLHCLERWCLAFLQEHKYLLGAGSDISLFICWMLDQEFWPRHCLFSHLKC